MRLFKNLCMAAVCMAAVSFAIPLWALALSADVTLGTTATIGTTTPNVGSHHVVVDSKTNWAQFMQDGQVLAAAPGKPVSLKSKPPYTALVLNKDQIQEIQLSGKTEVMRIE
ncbi:MAG TPA: hypothetical protein VGS15_03295 [Candidatus Acidoferrales bacterium]|nr:hypothetical protein [Candidatus Acidoferrales bacterium]